MLCTAPGSGRPGCTVPPPPPPILSTKSGTGRGRGLVVHRPSSKYNCVGGELKLGIQKYYYCCGATVGSEQQHNQDLREIY